MMHKLFFLIVAWISFSEPLNAGLFDFFTKKPAEPAPTVKILLLHDRPGVVVEVKGKYRLYDPINFSYLSTRYIGKRKFIQSLSDGLQWGEEFPGLHQLMIVPDSQDVTTIVDGIEYRGSIYVYDVEGDVGIVNEVEIEDYLQSALANVHEPLPQEALAAMAIAARTHAYYYANNPQSPFWALDGSKVGYNGYAVTNLNSPIAQAIIATRYMVMSRSNEEGFAEPFPAQLGTSGPGVASTVSLSDAGDMARNGQHAAQILQKAFTGTSIVLMHCDEPGALANK